MKTTTNTYHRDKFIQSEKLCTLREFVEMNRLKPGQKLLIGKVESSREQSELHLDTDILYVGNCTPIHELTSYFENGNNYFKLENTKWNFHHPRMDKFVLEIHTF